MQNKDFEYQVLYVYIFYMYFQIFIIIVYAFRCVVLKQVKRNIIREAYPQRVLMTCNPLDKHTIRTRTVVRL